MHVRDVAPPASPRGVRSGRTHPADVVTLAIIVVVTTANAVGLMRGADLERELITHLVLLAGFTALSFWLQIGRAS